MVSYNFILTCLIHDDYLNFVLVYVRWLGVSVHSVYLVASGDHLPYIASLILYKQII